MSRTLLGIAGSLRNTINGELSGILIRDLQCISDEKTLWAYLQILSVLPDRSELIPPSWYPDSLLELYSALSEKRPRRGMSNSEVALAAALWKANRKGADIAYCSLKDHFSPSRNFHLLDSLRKSLLDADALLFAGPVYFGDRGSLIHELIQLLKSDKTLQKQLAGRLYGGIAVGAKRNGGQETTLIYQILDMVSLGFMAVGNDSTTTSQYGGTGHAGDVGKMCLDEYGLRTAMGVGQRMANLLSMLDPAARLRDRIKVVFLILQDYKGLAVRKVAKILEHFSSRIDATVINVTELRLVRCLACDVCPKKIDQDEIYRCRVGTGDDFCKIHPLLLDQDAVVPVAVSVSDHDESVSNYQVFMERTRYLRRGDYALSDILVSPLVFHDLGTREYLDVRMITSLIRHQTVISKPIIGYLIEGKVVNQEEIYSDFAMFLQNAGRIAAARLSTASEGRITSQYIPVGYVVSAAKDKEPEQLQLRRKATKARLERVAWQAKRRLL